jgi:DNA-directed RNA polymerase specialized sigma24 family protein
MEFSKESDGMTWQSEVSPAQWAEWQEIARTASKARKMPTSLGPEDYAATAIERLLEQKERPANVEAWLRKTINNQYIDRFRKIEARGGISYREWSDERWEEEMISHAVGSPSVIVAIKDQVVKVLNEKEKELLILAAAGFDNHQIAEYADYKNNKIVATRLAQIAQKVRDEVNRISSSSRLV